MTQASNAKKSPAYHIEALAKGLRVLALFSESRPTLRLTEIAAETDMLMPTVYRIAMTLTAEGYLEQLNDGQYRPGMKVLTLGYSALKGLDVSDLAKPPLERLAERTSETANLGVLSGDRLVYLIRIRNRDLVTASIRVGSVLPAVYTSMGKALLAHLDDDALHARITSASFDSDVGPQAKKGLSELMPELEVIRERGYALQDEEVAYGLRSVAAPVRGESNDVVAAINVAVNAREWSREQLLAEIRPQVVSTANEISALLGHR